MIIQLNDIMKADIIQLEDYDMQLTLDSFDFKRQLHVIIFKLYYGEERYLHGAILAQIRKEMPIGKFMSYVHRAKQEAGL